MKPGIFTIESKTALTDSVYRMVLSGDTSAITAPGQFVNIQLSGKFLRRPISVCDYDEKTLTIVYKVVGKGTAQMAAMQAGETLDILTGLGNGYDLSLTGDTPVLLGGGDPAYVEKMQALAAELGLGDSVIFAGVRSNIQSFYDAMDAFLLPSLFEGLPVVLVEAQTAGLPCFVADTVDRGAAFSDKVKFLPLNDTAAWANTIAAASFRRDPQAREKAIKAGYDIHTSAEVLQAFYLRRYAEVTP